MRRRRSRTQSSAWICLLLIGCIVAAVAPDAAMATKRIALTIDDVPSAAGPFLTTADRRVQLIAALKTAHVRQAAIFANPGRLAHDDPLSANAVTAYAGAGHVLANHTFTHPGLSASPADAYLADIAHADHWLRGRQNFRPWFRYPYLDEASSDPAKQDIIRVGLAGLKLRNAPATVDAWDWNLEKMASAAITAGKPVDRAALGHLFVQAHVASADAVDTLANRLLGRSPVQVMLLHETDVTALYLVDMVAALRADGWRIVTADRAYRDPLYRHVPAGANGGGLLIDAIASARRITDSGGQRYDDPVYQQRRFDEDVVAASAKPATPLALNALGLSEKTP
jgi:peptidoglycan-N-acetylglucosamine deacetylase